MKAYYFSPATAARPASHARSVGASPASPGGSPSSLPPVAGLDGASVAG